MTVTAKTADFKVTVGDDKLVSMVRRLGSRSALGRILKTFEDAAKVEKARIEDEWPVSYLHDGTERDKRLDKRFKAHSRDTFSIRATITSTAVRVSIVNSAPYAYKIRSRQVGESQTSREDRFDWNDGVDRETYFARITSGPKRHAWTAIGVRPFKKTIKHLSDEVADDLRKIAEGR
jgi:hypothetical protein